MAGAGILPCWVGSSLPILPGYQNGVGLMGVAREGLGLVCTSEASRALREGGTSFMMLISQLIGSRSSSHPTDAYLLPASRTLGAKSVGLS